jgi:phenylacetate-coenzyme A ligase PaaK-like adenylate-forming protein
VLGTETPASVSIRRFLAGRPELARELFGESRLPTLVQYDPTSRFFEAENGTLLFSCDNGVPLVRYHIADEGGVLSYEDVLEFCSRNGFTPAAGPALPFVFLFGRSLFTVSYFGANIYPENVAVGLEQPGASDWVTGKFVLETYEDADRDRRLRSASSWHQAGTATPPCSRRRSGTSSCGSTASSPTTSPPDGSCPGSCCARRDIGLGFQEPLRPDRPCSAAQGRGAALGIPRQEAT